MSAPDPGRRNGIELSAALPRTWHLAQEVSSEGLPVARKAERVFVDIEEARVWIALNEDFVEGSPKLAPVLHLDDPRYRERGCRREDRRA
jgi:hypothetical protein